MSRGFTLIELLLAVAIITVISSFSIAFYARFITQNSVVDTVDNLAADLRKAQMYAMSGKNNTNWGVFYANNKITLYQGSSYATRNATFDENYSVNSNITISGMSEVNFSRITGIPNTYGSIYISGNNSNKTVVINNQGVISR